MSFRLGYSAAVLCVVLLAALSCVQEIDRPGSVGPIAASGATPTATAELADATPTPSPSSTPTNTPTVTPEPTHTPEPTFTPAPPPPTPTPTVAATATPAPTSDLLLEVRGPADGAAIASDAVVVYGLVQAGAAVQVNGVDATVAADGSFQAEIPLAPGTNKIEVVASDGEGNSRTETLTVTSLVLPAQPFFLVVTRPQDQSIVTTSRIALAGRTSPDAIVSVNGVSVPVDILGVFEAEIRLQQGPNIIEVVATSATGEGSKIVLAVIYRPPSE